MPGPVKKLAILKSQNRTDPAPSSLKDMRCFLLLYYNSHRKHGVVGPSGLVLGVVAVAINPSRMPTLFFPGVMSGAGLRLEEMGAISVTITAQPKWWPLALCV